MNKRLCSTVIALALLCGACETDTGDPRFGVDVFGQLFDVTDPEEGIHPNGGVLVDPNNPFRDNPTSLDARFDILGSGAATATYYVWATQLAREPTGEAQYFTAVGLSRIYAAGAVVDESELETVRIMAIAAAQSVLDNFPESVTFDATGTVPTRVATLAYNLIILLEGTPEGDWVLVETGGEMQAVRASEPIEEDP